jgi:hypothetical protein
MESDMDSQRTGIESLLAMAAVDARFAASLYERRAETIDASGVSLSAAEQQILESVDEATLRRMVGSVSDAIAEPDRRAFFGQSAAALLAVAGVAGAAGCKEPVLTPETGIRSDRPATKGIRPDRPQPQGIRPDRPVPKPQPQKVDAQIVDAGSPPQLTGIRPDRPVKTGISPDRPTRSREAAGKDKDKDE